MVAQICQNNNVRFNLKTMKLDTVGTRSMHNIGIEALKLTKLFCLFVFSELHARNMYIAFAF